MTTVDIHLGGKAVRIQLERLSGRARALAEAISDNPAKVAGDIWMEADQPISATTKDWQVWFTPDEAAQPERRPWRGWSTVPLARGEDPHDRLEAEARKIPPGWHVLGAHPRRPIAKPERREATTEQVVAYLAERGRTISAATWRSYVGRGQAPGPFDRKGRTPLYDLDHIDAWLDKEGTNGHG